MRRYENVDLTDRAADPSAVYTALLDELRAEIARQRLSQRALALAMGESNQQWLSRRLIGVTPFTVPELLKLADLLGVDLAELSAEAARRAAPGEGNRPAKLPHKDSNLEPAGLADLDEVVQPFVIVHPRSPLEPVAGDVHHFGGGDDERALRLLPRPRSSHDAGGRSPRQLHPLVSSDRQSAGHGLWAHSLPEASGL